MHWFKCSCCGRVIQGSLHLIGMKCYATSCKGGTYAKI